MNVIACVKQIIDPELPPVSFEIDAEARRGIPPGRMSLIISDYDEVAVEAAMRIKESEGGKVTVLSLGDGTAMQMIKRCLAMGVDEGVLLNDSLFEEEDRSITAYALASAIRKIGNFDLILCGRQEGDWDGGQVGLGIAEILDIPAISPVIKMEVRGENVIVERIVGDGYEVIECPLPCVVAVSSELGEARRIGMKEMMLASRKKVPIWNADDIGFDMSRTMPRRGRTRLVKLFKPVLEGKCELIAGESPEEAGANLMSRLKEVLPNLI